MAPKPVKRKPAAARGSELVISPESVEIDFVILADFAQAVQGKLSLIGGGWNLHHTNQYPSLLPFGLGIGILVPWSEANRKHDFTFLIKGSEGPEVVRGGGQFEVGREAGIPAGMTLRVTVGLSGQLQIPQPGTYEVIVTAADAEKRITFEALPVPSTV